MTMDQKLDEILKILRRIEERQIKRSALVKELEQEQPQGGLGSTDFGAEKK